MELYLSNGKLEIIKKIAKEVAFDRERFILQYKNSRCKSKLIKSQNGYLVLDGKLLLQKKNCTEISLMHSCT